MFAVQQNTALKMVIKCNYNLQQAFINFNKRQCKIYQTKTSKNNGKTQKLAPIWAQKLPRNDLLTLN